MAVVIKTGGHTALGIVAREMGWAQSGESAPLYQTLGGLETAFEAHTEVFFCLPPSISAPAPPLSDSCRRTSYLWVGPASLCVCVCVCVRMCLCLC